MKVVNFVVGLGTAIIISGLITLGIAAFYPAPQAPVFPNLPPAPQCIDNSANCITQQNLYSSTTNALNNQFNQEQQSYENQTNIYDSHIFIIANIVGLLIFGFGFWLLFATSASVQSVPIGIMIAGVWGIFYGYRIGWGSVNDQLKFVIGLAVAVVLIGGSMWLMQRHDKKKRT